MELSIKSTLSFKDSNKDGYGDLKGLIENLLFKLLRNRSYMVFAQFILLHGVILGMM